MGPGFYDYCACFVYKGCCCVAPRPRLRALDVPLGLWKRQQSPRYSGTLDTAASGGIFPVADSATKNPPCVAHGRPWFLRRTPSLCRRRAFGSPVSATGTAAVDWFSVRTNSLSRPTPEDTTPCLLPSPFSLYRPPRQLPKPARFERQWSPRGRQPLRRDRHPPHDASRRVRFEGGRVGPEGGRYGRGLPGGRVESAAEVLDRTIAGDHDDTEGRKKDAGLC